MIAIGARGEELVLALQTAGRYCDDVMMFMRETSHPGLALHPISYAAKDAVI